jgi:uncharacterized membrane protein
VSQIITWIIVVPLVLLFLYFFAVRAERDKQKESRKHDAMADLYFNGTQKTHPQAQRLAKQKPTDPLLIFGYWVLLPLFFAFVTIIAIMLIGSLVK